VHLASPVGDHDLSPLQSSRLCEGTDDEGGERTTGPSINWQPHDGPAVNVFDLNSALIEDHVTLTQRERIAAALWITHTHIFQQFRITPRLAILSPVN
jgi:hypothetical protein